MATVLCMVLVLQLLLNFSQIEEVDCPTLKSGLYFRICPQYEPKLTRSLLTRVYKKEESV